MSIKFRVLGGGFIGGGSADFIFMGARIFLNKGEGTIALHMQHQVQAGDTRKGALSVRRIRVEVLASAFPDVFQPHTFKL